MPAHKQFECPHCEGPVDASLEELDAASAVLRCPECQRWVYLTMGKLSHYQPGDDPAKPPETYDSGA